MSNKLVTIDVESRDQVKDLPLLRVRESLVRF